MPGFEARTIPQTIESAIVRMARLSDRSKLSLWSVTPDDLCAATTSQIQLLRGAARSMARQPWRDNQMRADDLLHMTAVELIGRGTFGPRRD